MDRLTSGRADGWNDYILPEARERHLWRAMPSTSSPGFYSSPSISGRVLSERKNREKLGNLG